MLEHVYRVERSCGTGPYFHGLGYNVVHGRDPHADASAAAMPYAHPTPSNDGMGYCFGGAVFGFRSLEDLPAWFSKSDRSRMSRAGYAISVYTVARLPRAIAHGSRQCAFERVAACHEQALSLI